MPEILSRQQAGKRIALATASRFDFGGDEYLNLFASARACAFQHPVWLDAFYRHVAPAHGADAAIVTGRDETGRLVLLLPLIRRCAENGATAVDYAFLGVTDYTCPVIAEDARDRVTSDPRLPRRLREALGVHDQLNIGPVREQDVTAWLPLLGTEPRALDFGSHAVRYGRPYAEWRRATQGRRRAGSLDRKARRLAGEGTLQLEPVESHEAHAVIAMARDFRAGRFPDDPLQTPHGFQFYAEVATRGAAAGMARTYRLVSGTRTIAVVFGLVDDTSYRYVLLGCDYPTHGRHSPGLVALDRVMARWAEDGGEAFDFTIGDEAFKADFGAARTQMFEFG